MIGRGTRRVQRGGRVQKTQKAGAGKGKRVVYCQDAIPWLEKQKGLGAIVTSIPEMDEMGMTLKDYLPFFRGAARRCLEAVKETGYCIFLQTDRKYKGWIDKSYLITDEAEALGMRLLWHKIALRVEVGKADLYRPGYSHMLCYSKKGKIGIPIADVVERGEVTYPNAFGINAVRHVVGYLKKQGVKSVVDPFVGSGTVVAVANAMGMDAVGVDIDKKQCERARGLVLSLPS
jgi:hypothetical protein